MEAVLYIVAAILSVVGLTSIIRAISYRVFSSPGESGHIRIVKLQGEHADFVLSTILAQQKRYDFLQKDRVVAVDCGLPDQAALACEILCRREHIPLCDRQTLSQELQEFL